MKHLQLPINNGRCPTDQDLSEIRRMVELECLTDDDFITPTDVLLRNLRFEDAQIRIVEDFQIMANGRRVDAALLVWPKEKWCMVVLPENVTDNSRRRAAADKQPRAVCPGHPRRI